MYEQRAVVGTSSCGPPAIRFGLDYPDRTHGLVLIGSAVPSEHPVEGPSGPPHAILRDPVFWALINHAPWVLYRLFGIDRTEYDTAPPVARRRVTELLETLLPVEPRVPGLLADESVTNRSMIDRYDEYPLETLAVPTIVVHAEDDPLASFEDARHGRLRRRRDGREMNVESAQQSSKSPSARGRSPTSLTPFGRGRRGDGRQHTSGLALSVQQDVAWAAGRINGGNEADAGRCRLDGPQGMERTPALDKAEWIDCDGWRQHRRRRPSAHRWFVPLRLLLLSEDEVFQDLRTTLSDDTTQTDDRLHGIDSEHSRLWAEGIRLSAAGVIEAQAAAERRLRVGDTACCDDPQVSKVPSRRSPTRIATATVSSCRGSGARYRGR
ncbi:hypothetical protein ACFQL1_20885 [Halomicroarcula sp. GCM10025709]|uniref:hypothetical protein n=1 Tax=Halomicroarcula sp. GCM10025709 TaxID=3252669 RepID=UPI00361C2A8B